MLIGKTIFLQHPLPRLPSVHAECLLQPGIFMRSNLLNGIVDANETV